LNTTAAAATTTTAPSWTSLTSNNPAQEAEEEELTADMIYDIALQTARQEVAKEQRKIHHVDNLVPPTSLSHTAFEKKWMALPIASQVRLDLYVVPSLEAVLRFVQDRAFHVIASGRPTPASLRLFICSAVPRKSGTGTCLFLGELVLDRIARRLTGVYKVEKRKYLSIFLAALALHELDSTLSSGRNSGF
jgi:hypothetical protein